MPATPSERRDQPRHHQPLLHDAVVALRAPAHVWSGPDGSMGGRGAAGAIDGIYVSDVRVVGGLTLTVDGVAGEHLATIPDSASRIRFDALHRPLDGEGADPDTRSTLLREVVGDGVAHVFTLTSRLATPLSVRVVAELRAELATTESVKQGFGAAEVTVTAEDGVATWSGDGVTAGLAAPDAGFEVDGGLIRLTWDLVVPARGSASATFDLQATDAAAVVAAAPGPAPWSAPGSAPGSAPSSDDRLARWLARALDDLDALRLVRRPPAAPSILVPHGPSETVPGRDGTTIANSPADQFFAAGAPWFFTLFGRDAIWAARLLLPLGAEMAGGTLRVLAELQGAASVPATAEQPGKIMHELRRGATVHEEFTLPPLYYGTVDATPLWVCLLADAAEAGLADDEVRALLPHLEAALAWMRDFGDSDGDGLLEYVDETGQGLSNQGWKDSGDSVQWRDGSLAEGPIALCEVQAYAYEAAVRGANLLDSFDRPGSDEWRAWAGRLAARFRETFWIADPAGAYPAIALDAAKHPVDTVTSNIGHLLGTGLLDPDERALVARRLVSPELDSGFGLRTMSTDSAGYWPLSYHGGSVWTHDTAIAIAGLAREGFAAEAAQLSEGLLRAAVAFDYRMPELHSGDSAATQPSPAPYPAACRPQAWSAAAAVAVWAAARPRTPLIE